MKHKLSELTQEYAFAIKKKPSCMAMLVLIVPVSAMSKTLSSSSKFPYSSVKSRSFVMFETI